MSYTEVHVLVAFLVGLVAGALLRGWRGHI